MGVLNVTPDSFSDGGRYLDLASAVHQGEAVALCPREVKYHVYLGLAQEDLYKLERQSGRGEAWFKQAVH